MATDWTPMKIGVDKYADVKLCGTADEPIRIPPPSTVLTGYITKALASWPTELCRIVASYLTRHAHSWYAPPISWPELRLTAQTADVDWYKCNKAYSGGLTAISWYRVASAWTFADGRLRFGFNFSAGPTTDRFTGWLAFGVIADDPRPLTIRQGDWSCAIDFGADAWYVAVSSTDVAIKSRNVIDRRIMVLAEPITYIEFEADERTKIVTAVVDSYRFEIADFSSAPDRFYRLRPACLLSGLATATIVDPAAV
jgi:hypothetical protein